MTAVHECSPDCVPDGHIAKPVPYVVEAPLNDTEMILSAIADVQKTLDRYIELVEGMAEQVKPLMNSPMLKMFGGK